MRRTFLLAAVALAVSVPAFAQRTPRTPGRVGGSAQNRPVSKPSSAADLRAAKLTPSDLAPDEQKEFAAAQVHIPNLTVAQFLRIQSLSQKLSDRKIALKPSELAEKMSTPGKDVIGILQDLGIKKPDASHLVSASKKDAEGRALQLAK